MPQGYYTIEQWTRNGGRSEWAAVRHLPFGLSLTAAEAALASIGKPGLYRLVQTQRVVWAERDGSKFRLRKSHAGSPENLDQVRAMFERNDGRYPVEEVREARRRAKTKRER